MKSQQVFFTSVIVIVALLGTIMVAAPCIGGSTVTLDKESVFCAYYKLSGDIMYDQDIEDLFMELGKPTFSHYKPSELFTRRTIQESRNDLLEKMKLLDESSIFKWDITYACKEKRNKPSLDYSRALPQPTPFIAAKMSGKGQTIINTRLTQAIDTLQPEKPTILKISVYLKPQNVDNRFEDRNIGRQNAFFPLRSVEFHPVKMTITFEKNAKKLLASRNAHD